MLCVGGPLDGTEQPDGPYTTLLAPTMTETPLDYGSFDLERDVYFNLDDPLDWGHLADGTPLIRFGRAKYEKQDNRWVYAGGA